MNDNHQPNRPPHLLHMPSGPMPGAPNDQQVGPAGGDNRLRTTSTPPRVGLPHAGPRVLSGAQYGEAPRDSAPPRGGASARVGLPHVAPGVLASSASRPGEDTTAITNGNGAPPPVRHSVPSLHPAPKLGLPHVSGVAVSQTLPQGVKPPNAGGDYNSKTASLDRNKDPTPPPIAPKPDKKRHSVLGIFKKSKKEK